MTAFYMFRLYFLVFWWEDRDYKAEGLHIPHDSPWTMSLPLIFLAVVSTVCGWIDFGDFVTYNGHEYPIHMNTYIAVTSVCVALVGIGLAAKLYLRKNDNPRAMADKVRWLWEAAHHRFYWDEIYLFITRRIIFDGICKPIAWFDRHIIDGAMDGLAVITNKASVAIKGLQSGKVQMYILWYLLGALALGAITALCLL